MKKIWMVLALFSVMIMNAALAAELEYPNSLLFGVPEGPAGSCAILVELPEDTVLIEQVGFENGDFIQTYQLPNGAIVQILRYAEFDMTLEELAEGEWTGYTSLTPIDTKGLDGLIQEGIHLTKDADEQGGEPAYDVYMLRAQTHSPEQVHLFQAVFPSEIGRDVIEAQSNAMLDSILVQALDLLEWG